MNSHAPYSPDQKRALDKAAALCQKHNLSGNDIDGALMILRSGNQEAQTPHSRTGFITALLGYLGGSLIVAGFLIYASMIWGDLGSFGRVTLSLGSGFLCYFCAYSLQCKSQYAKAAMPLWLLSFLLLPTGLFVMLKEYAGGDDAILGGVIVFGICTAMYLTAWFKLRVNILLIIALLCGFAFLGTFYEKLGINTPEMWLPTAIGILLLGWQIYKNDAQTLADKVFVFGAIALITSCYHFLGNTDYEAAMTALMLILIFIAYKLETRLFIVTSILCFIILLAKHFGFSWGYRDSDILRLTAGVSGISCCFMAYWLSVKTQSRMVHWWYFGGSFLLFNATMGLLYNTPYDVLFPAIPAFVLYLSIRLQSRALLTSSILALLSFISYFSARYFAETIGWPITLMITGAALIGLCLFALKLGKRMQPTAMTGI